MTPVEPRCRKRECVNFLGIKWTGGRENTEVPYCRAFPNGIPHEIAYGDNLHLTPVDGDDGIVYAKQQPRV